MKHSHTQMDDELDKAIESALGHIQSSVAASALLEVCLFACVCVGVGV